MKRALWASLFRSRARSLSFFDFFFTFFLVFLVKEYVIVLELAALSALLLLPRAAMINGLSSFSLSSLSSLSLSLLSLWGSGYLNVNTDVKLL